MTLVDTSVIIACLRTAGSGIIELVRGRDAAICGVIRSEVLHGARGEAELGQLNEALDDFHQLRTTERDWDQLGRNLYSLRVRGITIPLADALIAAVAMRNGIEVWTYDAHFERMQAVLSELKLFREPT